MRISDWSSDVCSSDLGADGQGTVSLDLAACSDGELAALALGGRQLAYNELMRRHRGSVFRLLRSNVGDADAAVDLTQQSFIAAFSALHSYDGERSEEHTSELQSLMRISYADFCLKKKKNNIYK